MDLGTQQPDFTNCLEAPTKNHVTFDDSTIGRNSFSFISFKPCVTASQIPADPRPNQPHRARRLESPPQKQAAITMQSISTHPSAKKAALKRDQPHNFDVVSHQGRTEPAVNKRQGVRDPTAAQV